MIFVNDLLLDFRCVFFCLFRSLCTAIDWILLTVFLAFNVVVFYGRCRSSSISFIFVCNFVFRSWLRTKRIFFVFFLFQCVDQRLNRFLLDKHFFLWSDSPHIRVEASRERSFVFALWMAIFELLFIFLRHFFVVVIVTSSLRCVFLRIFILLSFFSLFLSTIFVSCVCS